MKKLMTYLLLLTITTSGVADEVVATGSYCDGYPSRDSTALSMMGWGISLFVGIAALVCLIPNHTSK